MLPDGAVPPATGDPLLRPAGMEGRLAGPWGTQLVGGGVPAARAQVDQRGVGAILIPLPQYGMSEGAGPCQYPRGASLFVKAFVGVAIATCTRARVSEALGVKVERPQRREDERP